MTAQPRPTTPPRPAALDTRSLGRPVHLLPQVAQRLREALQRALVQPWNRRYHSRYELQALTLRPFAAQDAAALTPSGATARWLRANGPAGPLACRIDRPLVLALMARRLGLGADTALATADTPPTATEDRLLHLLAGQFTGLSLQWLAQAARPEDEAEQDLTPLTDLPALQSGPLPTLNDAWTLTVAMRDMTPALPPAMPANASFKPEAAEAPAEPEADGAYEQADPAATPSSAAAVAADAAPAAAPPQDMTLSLILDGAYLQPLLRRLSGQHRPARSGSAVGAPPLTRRLTLTLQARLLERELDLGAVLDLAPGALIPIRLADATVMVEGSALMSAAVAEHQGKLCLTSFQDLE